VSGKEQLKNHQPSEGSFHAEQNLPAMRIFTFILSLFAFFLLALPGLCQEKTLLIIPFEVRGNYKPFDSAAVTERLRSQIENAEKVDVNASVYDQMAYMMSPEEATRLGKEAGVDLVLYGDIQFRVDVTSANLQGANPNQEGYPGGTGIRQGFAERYMVTVGAVGHGKLVNVADGKIIAERPEMLMETEYTGAVKGGAKMEKLEQKLADACLAQFSAHLLESLAKEAKSSGS
jgi:hypothetical protein